MAKDIRQVIAAFLTLSMFLMLGNMIKRDHFDSIEMKLPVTSNFQFGEIKVTQQSLVALPSLSKDPWISNKNEKSLKPCWNMQTNTSRKGRQSKGYITFSLSNGPEYHSSQIADAVAVAKYLKATLVIPEIIGSKPGEKMIFEEIYDTETFIRSLDGIINIAEKHHAKESNQNLGVVKIPNGVTEDYIANHIQPIFEKTMHLKLTRHFPSIINTENTAKNKYLDDKSMCLAIFGTLKLQPEVQEVIDSMVAKLRTLSHNSNGKFIALDMKGCRKMGSIREKSCYDAQEIGELLNKIGFDKETVIYLIQSRWHNDLDSLREIFPKTYTKENIIPAEKKTKFLNAEKSEVEKVIDFYVCSESDVFVPGSLGMFYKNVAGKRIGAGLTQILVPAQKTSNYASDYISPYISKKKHFAYSCFC